MTSAPSLTQVRIASATFDSTPDASVDPELARLNLLWIQLAGSPIVQAYCDGPVNFSGSEKERSDKETAASADSSADPTAVYYEPPFFLNDGESSAHQNVDGADAGPLTLPACEQSEDRLLPVVSSLEFWEAVAELHAVTTRAPDSRAHAVHSTVGEVAQRLPQLQSGPDPARDLSVSSTLSQSVTSTARAMKQSIDIIAAFESLLCGMDDSEFLSSSRGAPALPGALGRGDAKMRSSAESAVFSVLTLRDSSGLSATGRRG